MSTSRFLWLTATLVALSAIATQAHAQHEIHHVPPVINPDGYNPDVAQPFIEPFTFQSDLQFFAPAEVDRINSEIEASTGWYATYDRAYIYVTRPQAESSYAEGDFTWGNRIDLGYMTEEDHGWLISFLHIDGPNNYQILEQERINVVEPDDEINFPPDGVILRGAAAGGGGGQQQQPTFLPGFPVRDRNNPVTNARDYQVRDSINVADLSSFEFNKTFRIHPLHFGSIIEPFFGFRFLNFNDYTENDVYSRFDSTTGALIFTTDSPVFFPPPPIAGIGTEEFSLRKAQFENNMFGGQIGMRWFKQKSRWNLSGEVRAFAAQNFQAFTVTTDTEHTIYASGTGTPDISGVLYNSTINSAHAAEFVFGTEVRAEAAYDITKYLQLRAGMQFMEFARGIGRGNNILQNDQDVTMAGATFGVAVNR